MPPRRRHQRLLRYIRQAMMGLLSTIRGKKDAPKVIAGTDVTPITPREKKIVIQEWPKMLNEEPHFFQKIWLDSATRSTSIKKAFGIGEQEDPTQNEQFVSLARTIEAFFYKLVVTYELDMARMQTTCEQLGARHVDFIARGFHSTYWDIFMVCMCEVVDQTLARYAPAEDRQEIANAWQRVIHNIVHHMRTGYSERRKETMKAPSTTTSS